MHVVFSLADRITVLAQGTPLVEDAPENIKGNPKVHEAYLGEVPLKEGTRHADEKPLRQERQQRRNRTGLLSVWNIEAYYGESYIVQDVSFNVHEGEILALLGRNGAGKTTTLRAIARMDSPELRIGEIWLDHQPLHKMKSYEASQQGIALVPEDRRIIPGLTVEENLKLAQIAPPIGWSLERIYSTVPAPRRARKPGRHHPVGRRTADACDRPRLGARHQGPASGRTLRGPRPRHRSGDRQDAEHHPRPGHHNDHRRTKRRRSFEAR